MKDKFQKGMNKILGYLIYYIKFFLKPAAHHFICKCGRPIHPWEDECPICGTRIKWPEELREKYPKPDWFSKVFERNTSYKRWREQQEKLINAGLDSFFDRIGSPKGHLELQSRLDDLEMRVNKLEKGGNNG